MDPKDYTHVSLHNNYMREWLKFPREVRDTQFDVMLQDPAFRNALEALEAYEDEQLARNLAEIARLAT